MTQTRRSSASAVAPTDLKAPIQQALESLAINLDEELMRYRQARQGDGTPLPTKSQMAFRKRRKQVDVIAMTKTTKATKRGSAPATHVAAGTQRPVPPAPSTPAAAPVMAVPPGSQHPSGPGVSSQAAPTTLAGGSHALTPRGGPLAAYTMPPDDYLASTEVLLNSGAYPEFETSPYDEPYDDTDYTPSLRDRLMTPLGMGALLLLLLGSASFGYVVTSPNTLSHLARLPLLQRLTAGNSDTETDPAAVAEGDSSPANSAAEGPLSGLTGMGPDLSEEEFKDLDLSRISTLPSESKPMPADSGLLPEDLAKVQPTPADAPLSPANLPGISKSPTTPRAEVNVAPVTPAVRPTVTAPSQVNAAPRPTPQVAPQPAPARSAAPSAPPAQVVNQPPQPLQSMAAAQPAPPQPLRTTAPASAAQQPPAPITQAPPAAATPNYYVVADYTGDQSLSAARTVVGDAYVRNFPAGAKIQMGAFSQAGAAQNLVQQLQNQGIPAQVYTP